MDSIETMQLVNAGYSELANAVVIQAAEDYGNALAVLMTKHMSKDKVVEAQRMMGDCERFFKGSWYMALTSIPSDVIIGGIRDGIENAINPVCDEQEKRLKCVCGKKIPLSRVNGDKPVVKCNGCCRYIRLFGEPV